MYNILMESIIQFVYIPNVKRSLPIHKSTQVIGFHAKVSGYNIIKQIIPNYLKSNANVDINYKYSD